MGANQGTEKSTIVLLKPDTTIRGDAAANILQALQNSGFIPLQAMEIVATPDIIRRHYQTSFQHYDPELQNMIVQYMCCGSILVLRFTDRVNGGKGVVHRMRIEAGNSRRADSRLYTLRSEFMISAFINSIHSSDSEAEAQREMEVWRPHFENMPQRMEATRFVQQYIDRHRGGFQTVQRTADIRAAHRAMCKEIMRLKYSTCNSCGETEYAKDLELLKSTDQMRNHRDILIGHFSGSSWNNVAMTQNETGQSIIQVAEPVAPQDTSAAALVDIMIAYAVKYESSSRARFIGILIVLSLVSTAITIYCLMTQ